MLACVNLCCFRCFVGCVSVGVDALDVVGDGSKEKTTSVIFLKKKIPRDNLSPLQFYMNSNK